jgi:hypothetical protein
MKLTLSVFVARGVTFLSVVSVCETHSLLFAYRLLQIS